MFTTILGYKNEGRRRSVFTTTVFRNDFGFGNHFITPERLEVMDMTIPYHIDRACFAVPAAKVARIKLLNKYAVNQLNRIDCKV